MGPAPLMPTHETKVLARKERPLNGSVLMNTLSGRLTSTIKTNSIRAGNMRWPIREGCASRPSIMNIIICISHVSPSKNLRMSFLL